MCRAFIFSLLLLLGGCGSSEQTLPLHTQADACDVAQNRCEVQVDGLIVSLTLQAGVRPLKPFAVTAEIDGGEGVEQVMIEFHMGGMEMGPNRYRLIADGSRWRGTSTLPVCTASRTDWLAIVEFSHAAKQYSVSFPFTTL